MAFSTTSAKGPPQTRLVRESTLHEANRLGVRGWVRNLPDGRVEAVFEGAPAAVDAMLAWAERGPVHARVDTLTQDPEVSRGEPGFRVR